MLCISPLPCVKVMELGVRTPAAIVKSRLGTGEVGYVVAGVKNVLDARVGDTITLAKEREQRSQWCCCSSVCVCLDFFSSS